jgi:hypothetical protein
MIRPDQAPTNMKKAQAQARGRLTPAGDASGLHACTGGFSLLSRNVVCRLTKPKLCHSRRCLEHARLRSRA